MSEAPGPVASAAFLTRSSGRYAGPNLLWFMDPENPFESHSEVDVETDRVQYTWSHEGQPHSGVVRYSFTEEGVEAEWTDTWHAPNLMRFRGPHLAGALIASGTYSAGEGPEWGWRIELRAPAPQELLIEMFNIHPNGEEQIAVRLRAVAR